MSIKRLIRAAIEKAGYHICRKKYINELIREITGLYRDLLFHEMPVIDEAKINLMANLAGTGISESIYIITHLNNSLTLDGDICEFGVAQGGTSALMANEIKWTDKTIWLFDSFKGLSKPTPKDILKDDILNLGFIDAYQGTMACKINMVKTKLNAINFPSPRVKIIKGFIEETIKQSNLPSSVCFAYVDFDFYEPISIALNFLDKVLQIKGVVIVDDYDYFSTGAKTAVDEFITSNREKYTLSLPIKSAGHFCIIEKIS